jgi:hypothetical protein
MPANKSRRSGSKPTVGESVDIIARTLTGFDFKLRADDFVLFELSRLIDEDRASFEDEEFRILIDEGIQQHVEENLHIRAELAGRLRDSIPNLDPDTQTIARRVIRALENIGYDLRNAGVVVRTYTAYLFDRLQTLEATSKPEQEARARIESWKHGKLAGEDLTAAIHKLGEPAVGPIAELLLNEPENRESAELAVELLSSIRSAASSRVLAHVIAEPLLDEDLEMRAFASVLETWPSARPFILHSIDSHAHEDLPFRWFQILMEAQDLKGSQLIYDELCVHGRDANYREDLWALTMLLSQSRDPEIEDQVMGWLNSAETPSAVVPMLQEFLKDFRKPQAASPNSESPDPWRERSRMLSLNEQYVGAAELWDSGQRAETKAALDRILEKEPEYPFAVMLKAFSNRYTT